MKNKLILVVLMAIVTSFYTGCAKIAFTPKEPVENTALVYIYSIPNSNVSDTDTSATYKLFINGESVEGDFTEYEYTSFDFKPVNVTLTIAKNYLERKNLKLDLKAGNVYYLRVQSQSNDFGKFTFTDVSKSVALKELQATHLAGKYANESKNLSSLINSSSNDDLANTKNKLTQEDINTLIDEKMKAIESNKRLSTTSPVSSTATGSKLDDIRNAYEMKKQGLLSDEEFKAMKAEILAK